jgi:hypothetical protein
MPHDIPHDIVHGIGGRRRLTRVSAGLLGPSAVAFLKYLEQNQLYDPILDRLRSAVRYDKTYFDKIVASLLPCWRN